jgi:hypothetical protein
LRVVTLCLGAIERHERALREFLFLRHFQPHS